MPTRSSRLFSVLFAVVVGCARTSAAPPTAQSPAPVSRGSGVYAGAAPRAPAASVTLPSSIALDPTEAITPRELASIPDPIVGEAATNPARGAPDKAAAIEKIAAADSEIAQARPAAPYSADTRAELPRGAASGDERRGVWRVQVFASPDLTQADRIAKEASLRFGEPSVIEFEDSLYKVRLGAFATEALAQSLRERAVLGGFPGAFRMWNTESATSSTK